MLHNVRIIFFTDQASSATLHFARQRQQLGIPLVARLAPMLVGWTQLQRLSQFHARGLDVTSPTRLAPMLGG